MPQNLVGEYNNFDAHFEGKKGETALLILISFPYVVTWCCCVVLTLSWLLKVEQKAGPLLSGDCSAHGWGLCINSITMNKGINNTNIHESRF